MRFKDNLQKELYYRSQIDYAYYRIEELRDENKKSLNKSVIASMIDEATGFGKKATMDKIDETEFLLSLIIRCKGKLGFETDGDKVALKAIRKLKKLNNA